VLNHHPVITALLTGFVAAILATTGIVQPATAADAPISVGGPPGTDSSSSPSGLTVSWLPTNEPVQTAAGQTSTGTFWVSNGTKNPISVVIKPITAVPGNNGNLTVQSGADGRFPSLTYSPSEFVAQPNTTTAVTITTTIPSTLGSGGYILPALVEPASTETNGNIKIQQSIVALVTFQVPGPVDARLKPTFIGATGHSNMIIRQIPGLPTIQISGLGRQTLRVLNDSTASLYSYNEITAAQTPFGSVTFSGHTLGVPTDLRTDSALYFPGLYRDYPVSWNTAPWGFGVAHLTAYVSYHPDPTTIKQISASTTVVVISPWWLLAIVLYLGVILAVADHRTRRHSKRNSGRRRARLRPSSIIWQILGSLILAVIVAVTAFFSDFLVFTITGAVGLALAVLLAADAYRRDAVSSSRRILIYQSLIGLVLIVGIATLVFSTWTPGIAIGTVSGAGIWTLLAWWIHTWNTTRQNRVSRASAIKPA
jgi:hypothetical protein